MLINNAINNKYLYNIEWNYTKIINWNCKFREKFRLIMNYGVDVYIIRECENPILIKKDYKEFLLNSFWVGNNKNKGLGIFAKKSISLEKLLLSKIFFTSESK